MLTIFAVPKAFQGEFRIIQRNAIRSWTLLQPAVEILLFGNEEGTAELAADLGLRHIREVKSNEFGTPLVDDLFQQAESLAANSLLCYVNSDIILMNDFSRAVRSLPGKDSFLMVGRRWNLIIDHPLDFSVDWEEGLRMKVLASGELEAPDGIDYFVFPRGFWGEIPSFAVGRTMWDNWLIYRARSNHRQVIDATATVMVVHQRHAYSSVTKSEIWRAPEAMRNLELGGGYQHAFTLEDVTHRLTRRGVKRAWRKADLLQSLARVPVLHPDHPLLARVSNLLLRLVQKIPGTKSPAPAP